MALRAASAFGRGEAQAHPGARACFRAARPVDASGRAHQHPANRYWRGPPVLRLELRNERQYQGLSQAQTAERLMATQSLGPLRPDAWADARIRQAERAQQVESSMGLRAVAPRLAVLELAMFLAAERPQAALAQREPHPVPRAPLMDEQEPAQERLASQREE
jgi:transcriptional regulator with XRE-family HTH domain